MTNEQLQIFLHSLADNLQTACDAADSMLGDSVERHTTQKYIGKQLIPPFFRERNPEEWTEQKEGAISLDPIRAEIEKIRRHAQCLTFVSIPINHQSNA